MANNTVKRVLILYNPKSEHTSDIIDHFCDALNAAKPYGCVKVSPDDNIVEFSENEREAIKERFVKWLEVPNNIVVVCISSSIPREDFTKDQVQLRSKIFPVCFGNKIPSHWPPDVRAAKLTPISSRKGGTKHALFLYKSTSERSSEIMKYFYDALNQVNPPGCVAMSRKNAVNLLEHDNVLIKDRILKWLAVPNNIVILCISSSNDQSVIIPREDFTNDQGKLPSKLLPLCFGTEIPSQWFGGKCYSLGVENPDKIKRPNEFEGKGLDSLVAAILGVA
ncbi:hypothetical protein pdam_00021268 [Pocillopora damicornis]|uniref:Uncharacterized protein n=1 Tax=Pocillopora damicornis TaxID=46731 RepID=A0A3M6TEW3_POCDA|nr:hypothetical protein pdam_00021268 [Pocillopora damicornis]